jgi:hypothetical protein
MKSISEQKNVRLGSEPFHSHGSSVTGITNLPHFDPLGQRILLMNFKELARMKPVNQGWYVLR